MMNKSDYQKKKIDRLTRIIANRDARSKRFAILRFVIFALTVSGMIVLYIIEPTFSVWFLIVMVLIFNIVAFFHRQVDNSLNRFRLWRKIAQDHLARLQIDWDALPQPKDEPVDPLHPFDKDLSITGRFSLLQLLDITISKQGKSCLKEWLLASIPDVKKIIYRQKIVQELTTSPFIDKLRLNFMQVGEKELNGEKVSAWLSETQSTRKLLLQSVGAFLLWLAIVVLFLADLLGWMQPLWGYAIAAYLVYVWTSKNVWQKLSEDAQFLDLEFKQSMAIFRYVEKFNYHNKPNLQQLCSVFQTKSKPSSRMRSMTLVALVIGFRMNYLTWIFFNLFIPWDFICALWINFEKQKLAPDFDAWLNVCYKLEALCSLANIARLNVQVSLPKIVRSDIIDMKNIGHPFIAQFDRVSNDYKIEKSGFVDLITGSNMSGKSTFLRTLGINLVLAYTGGFVFAESCELPLLKLFACVQVDDSLTRGLSQFYAEVKRLRQLNDALENNDGIPIFFLIDEIYKGTNNRERLIGSRSFIRQLVHKNGSGVVTTHDLELTHLERDLQHFRNFHFREHIKENKLAFDYKLKPGPCPTTNALKIMQMEGLPVDDLSGDLVE